MPINCIAFGCTNKQKKLHNDTEEQSEQRESRIAFHRFPHNDKERLKKWENSVRRMHKNGIPWSATPYSFICSNHFKPSDYITPPGPGRCKLKNTAVPTIFEVFPNHLRIAEENVEPPELERNSLDPLDPPQISLSKVMECHSYFKPPSGDFEIVSRNIILRRKIKTLQQKINRKTTKIQDMAQLINELRNNLLIKTREASLLHNSFDGLQLSMFANSQKNSSKSKQGRRYSESVRKFAITLYSYSPKAYNFVKGILNLPHPSMVRKWCISFRKMSPPKSLLAEFDCVMYKNPVLYGHIIRMVNENILSMREIQKWASEENLKNNFPPVNFLTVLKCKYILKKWVTNKYKIGDIVKKCQIESHRMKTVPSSSSMNTTSTETVSYEQSKIIRRKSEIIRRLSRMIKVKSRSLELKSKKIVQLEELLGATNLTNIRLRIKVKILESKQRGN